MWTSFFNFIASFFTRATNVVDTAGAAVDMTHTWVHAHAAKQKVLLHQRIRTETSEELEKLQARIDADDNVRNIYDQLGDMFKENFSYQQPEAN